MEVQQNDQVTKSFVIGGNLYQATFILDNTDDMFPYYLKDNNGDFCTRVAYEYLDTLKELSQYADMGEFVSSFGDNVTCCTKYTDEEYNIACENYGSDYVNVLGGYIVVMTE